MMIKLIMGGFPSFSILSVGAREMLLGEGGIESLLGKGREVEGAIETPSGRIVGQAVRA